ncbi:MAG: dTMP kinase [bacterium]
MIDFEGIDGSGKTTQAEMSLDRLSSLGIPVKLFREPTNGKFGKIIRDILSGRLPKRSPRDVLDLFIKDREENVTINIRPALKRNEVVLLDRYYYSTMAYQGALGIDVEEIRLQNESFAPKPDLVLIFLIPVDKAITRIRAVRRNGVDNYEKEAFLIKVDKIFRSFRDPHIRFINGERPLLHVSEEVKDLIDNLISEHSKII